MNENLKRILGYIKENPGWCSAAIIGLGRAILYSYQVGYAYYFNVGIRRIDIINGNIVFQLLLYAVLAGLLIFFYQIGYRYYKKGKLILYLTCFGAIFFILCSAFVLKMSQGLPTFSEIIYVGWRILLLSAVITLVFNFIVISHVLCPSLKDSIEITQMRLQKTRSRKMRSRLQMKLNKLNGLQRAADSKRRPDNFSDMPMTFKIVFCAGMASLCFVSFLCLGYVSASSKREFKTVDNAYVELRHEAFRDGFAVVFEDNDEYVAVPYEHANGALRLYIKEQITLEEKNVFTVEKSFESVSCIVQ